MIILRVSGGWEIELQKERVLHRRGSLGPASIVGGEAELE